MRTKATHAKLHEVERALKVSKSFVERGPNPEGVYYQPLPGSQEEQHTYRRGKRQRAQPERRQFASPAKQKLSSSISQYVSGAKTASDFKNDLLENDVELSANLRMLLRRNEAGDTVKYSTFGKEIFK